MTISEATRDRKGVGRIAPPTQIGHRDGTMQRTLEEGDNEKRAELATKNAIKEGLGRTMVSTLGGGAVEGSLWEFMEDRAKQSNEAIRGRMRRVFQLACHNEIRSKASTMRDRQVQVLNEQKMVPELSKSVAMQSGGTTKRHDIIHNSLEGALQRNSSLETLLQKELNKETMMSFNGNDVSEVCFPPRTVEFAKQHGLVEGWSLDLTTANELGGLWDFSSDCLRNNALHKVKVDQPMFIIGSPVCTNFSVMINPAWGEMSEAERQRRMIHVRSHLNVCFEVCKAQRHAGRYILHEHAFAATSRQEPGTMVLANIARVIRTNAHMCRYGMTKMTEQGPRFVKKPAGFPTNSPTIASHLDGECQGDRAHVTLHGKTRTQHARIYPEQLCRAICQGLQEHKRLDAQGLSQIGTVDSIDEDEMRDSISQPAELHVRDEWEEAWDDARGKALRFELVKASRKQERNYLRAMGVHDEVPISIGARWADTGKQRELNPEYRSLLVATEVRRAPMPNLYAAPPFECLTSITSSVLNSSAGGARKDKIKMMIGVGSRAYSYAPAIRPAYMKIVEDDLQPGDDEQCRRFDVSMYGARGTALNRHAHCKHTFAGIRFHTRQSQPMSVLQHCKEHSGVCTWWRLCHEWPR